MRMAWTIGWVLSVPALAPAAVLYDGSLGTLPGTQGWLYGTNPLVGASANQSVIPGGVNLDSTPAISDKAGYFSTFHPSVPTLDRATGFTIRIDLKVLADNHAGSDKNADLIDDRAGFSLIALSADHRGVELGFWADRVWAQDTAFHHAEQGLINTTAAARTYDLAVLNNDYWVNVDGSFLFGGTVRDYSSFGFPYASNNFVFWGDDTTSASGSTNVTHIEALASALPSPGAISLLMVGAMGFLARRPNRSLRDLSGRPT